MTNESPLRLGTRASALARWQADWVAAELGRLGVSVELVPITTSGDRDQVGPVERIGSVGVFTKELQRALAAGEIDLAVHSLKDLPTDPVEGLTLGCVPARGPTGDVLVCGAARNLDELPEGATIGTGSLRRQAQMLHVRPDLAMKDIRGNVDTRLRKLDDGAYDAIVLAEAGLRRLGLQERITQVLATEVMLPAVGQGALGVEIRADDQRTQAALLSLDDARSRAAVTAERAMLAELRGGCLAPVGALAQVGDATLQLSARVMSHDGEQKLEAAATGEAAQADEIGRQVAKDLIDRGADELIRRSRGE